MNREGINNFFKMLEAILKDKFSKEASTHIQC
jgi:hypothetical protein